MELAQQARRQQLDIYEQFRRLNPKEFSGTTDLFVVGGWIRCLELHFRYLNLRDVDRLRCVTFMLLDDTSLWWEGAAHAVNLAILTWNQFKDLFYDKYFTAKVWGHLTRDFTSLRQVDSYVAEFIQKFDRGCHFVPLIARDAVEKLMHFMNGLRPTMRRDVMLMRPIDYEAATSCAYQAEQALREIDV
ncbi:uncharacterized protein [Primulina eburnea]|uniref:uncharacterized protein n=1 Tax=Primulina eburnea TaxID=1245227 RepID=UPI003C6CB4D6